MILSEILGVKGSDVYTIGVDDTLDEVVSQLVEHNFGSLVVCAGDRIRGIITERDILRASARNGGSVAGLKVQDYMTADVITGHASDLVEDTMGLMTARRIRHLPIVEEDALVGMVSIGDVVKAQHKLLCLENHHLKQYIQS